MSAKRVFLYVQHLLGVGHLKRAVTLARAMAAEGLQVTLASGGAPVPELRTEGVRLVQLPPAAAADASFKLVLDAQGRPIDEQWRTRRRDALLEAWRAARAHALVIELFPFGRRQMRFELLPLLEEARRARQRPVVVSSVRDVLGGAQRSPERQDEMLEMFERHFDHLLVHGDPAFLALDRTFRHAARLGERLHYTGYVIEHVDAARGAERAAKGEVIVSAGGGAVGERLLETAIRARALTSLRQHTWRVLAGVSAPAAVVQRLTRLAAEPGREGVIVERSRSDFPALLRSSSLSVSQAGYNTLMEVLDARARAVVVPFSGAAETEQALRAGALAERGRVEVVTEEDLSPESLAAAVDRAMRRPAPEELNIALNGAQRSAALVSRWIAGLVW